MPCDIMGRQVLIHVEVWLRNWGRGRGVISTQEYLEKASPEDGKQTKSEVISQCLAVAELTETEGKACRLTTTSDILLNSLQP